MTIMRLWLFRFTQPDRLCCSVRVAAPTRQDACTILGARLGRPLISQENVHPEEGTILTAFGKLDVPEMGVVGFVDLGGQLVENI